MHATRQKRATRSRDENAVESEGGRLSKALRSFKTFKKKTPQRGKTIKLKAKKKRKISSYRNKPPTRQLVHEAAQ